MKGITVLSFFLLGTTVVSSQSLNSSPDRPSHGTIAEIKGKKQSYTVKGKGSPEVVFLTGLGITSEGFGEIQKKVSKKTKTFSYDRAGLGKSQAYDTERTLANESLELKELLEATGHKEPVIIVAHSRGAMLARYFVNAYPEKVSAIVLIDPAMPEIRSARLALRTVPDQIAFDSLFKANFGPESQYSKSLKGEFSANYYTDSAEVSGKNFPAAIPITVLVSVKITKDKYSEADNKVKLDGIKQMMKSSPQARIIETTKSGHFIHLEEPKMVRKEILRIVKAMQASLKSN